MSDLAKQKCVPCEVGAPPMSKEEAQRHLKEVNGWTLREKSLTKQFKFKDFVEAMEFVNKVAQVSEREGHHPDISISYNKVALTLSTHSIGGLSKNDFILAAKIDRLTTQ